MKLKTNQAGSPGRSGPWLMLVIGALYTVLTSGCAHSRKAAAKPGGGKRVVVDKTVQTLSAYEGENLVIQSHVSTGRAGKGTPSGKFTVGFKESIHYSHLYDNAPMPWSVQVHGNFFIHGFSSVPDYPASHGCIRVPLSGDNPAKRFYEWVETGTPVTITGEWAGKPRVQNAPR